MSPAATHSVSLRRAMAIVAVVFAGFQLLGLAAFPRVEAAIFRQAAQEADEILRLVSGTIDQSIGRYDPVPALIAQDPIFRDLLGDAENQGLVPFVNEKLRLSAAAIKASEVYLMTPAGLTIASSNYREPDSFVGKNFAFRPYFQRALSGGNARYHALGTTTGERGFFFAAPVLVGIEVVGVLALKVSVGPIEALWEGQGRDVLVADDHGVIFLSTRPDFRLRALAPLREEVTRTMAQTRQFPLSAVAPLPLTLSSRDAGPVELVLRTDAGSERYVSNSVPLTLRGWHATVLQPLRPIQARAASILGAWALVVTALTLAAIAFLQRRARMAERIGNESRRRETLEAMVRERTADLDAANASLRGEIEERKAAEDQLRKAQSDLVQAGKLAALGKISAALSHEINQPLAAIKSYADNAAQYLDRGRYDAVGSNITHISQMIDRVARISAHLRNFARRPRHSMDSLGAIAVSQVIADAVEVVRPHMRSHDATLRFDPPATEIWAIGGPLRLQQVLVNILTNAVDAMADRDERLVTVTLDDLPHGVEIRVRDTGPGLPETDAAVIFEPFFTTKEVGSGMGLGLSISYNIVEDFGGALRAANHPGGGAEFVVTLKPATASAQVAE